MSESCFFVGHAVDLFCTFGLIRSSTHDRRMMVATNTAHVRVRRAVESARVLRYTETMIKPKYQKVDVEKAGTIVPSRKVTWYSPVPLHALRLTLFLRVRKERGCLFTRLELVEFLADQTLPFTRF